MRKNSLAAVLISAVLLFSTSCISTPLDDPGNADPPSGNADPPSGNTARTPDNETPVPDIEDTAVVSIVIQEVDPFEVSFVFENTTEKEFVYRGDLDIAIERNGAWEVLEQINEKDDIGPLDEKYPHPVNTVHLAPMSTSKVISEDWRWWLGELYDGHYKLQL